MSTYISLLKGINVGGHKPVKMESLKKHYEKIGCQNVRTYLQSGNVIFTKKDTDDVNLLEEKIEIEIEKALGFKVPVLILETEQLKGIIEKNPLLKINGIDQAFLHLTFLSSLPVPYEIKIFEDKRQDGEEISIVDRAVYLYCPKGYGRTKLTNACIESKLKVIATTRNWKTATELLKIAEKDDEL